MKLKAKSEDITKIVLIIERVNKSKFSIDPMTLYLDLIATHCNGNPLNLEDMITGSDTDFYHDIFGIMKHIDRRTGQLKDFFSPRFSL